MTMTTGFRVDGAIAMRFPNRAASAFALATGRITTGASTSSVTTAILRPAATQRRLGKTAKATDALARTTRLANTVFIVRPIIRIGAGILTAKHFIPIGNTAAVNVARQFRFITRIERGG